MRQYILAGLVFLTCSVAFGQSDADSAVTITGEGEKTEVTINPEAIPDISKGQTFDEVQKLLAPVAAVRFDFESHIKVPPGYEETVKKGRELNEELRQLIIAHEPVLRAKFTVEQDDKLIQGFSTALFETSADMLLIFEDGRLLKTIEALPRPEEVVWDPKLNSKILRWLPIDTDERVAEVLNAPGLTPVEFKAAVKDRAERNIEAWLRYSELNTALLCAVEGTNLEKQAEIAKKEYLDRAKLAEKFDIRKVRVGSSIDELKEMFGEPIAIQKSEAFVTHVYGGRATDEPKIAVRLVEGRVIASFADDFFDDRLLAPPNQQE